MEQSVANALRLAFGPSNVELDSPSRKYRLTLGRSKEDQFEKLADVTRGPPDTQRDSMFAGLILMPAGRNV
jgi:hypothetical protein